MDWNIYKIRTTALGSTDSPPVTSMAIIDGQPAIAYSEDGALKYARYNPSTESWNESTVVASGVALKCEIKLVEKLNGNPMIFYYSKTSLGFRVIRSSSPDWAYLSDTKIDAVSADDNSVFAIGYYRNLESNLSYSSAGISGNYFTYAKSNDDCNSFYYINNSFSGGGTDVNKTKMSISGYIPSINYAFASFEDTSRSTLHSFTGFTGGTIATIESSLTNCDVIYANGFGISGDNYPTVYYTDSNTLCYKKSDNYIGTSWTIGRTNMFLFANAGVRPIDACEIDSQMAFVYRDSANAGINYNKGYNVRIVDTIDNVGNFGLASFDGNTYTSYYKYNSTSNVYEVWVASESALASGSDYSESSSSLDQNDYLYSFFENGSNLLNINGNMVGPEFIFPEAVNVCVLWGYSGNDMHNLKLEDVDNHRILCQLPKWSSEVMFSSVPSLTRLRIIVNDGNPGDTMNNYEVLFRFSDEGESTSIDESFSSYSTGSSESSLSSSTEI